MTNIHLSESEIIALQTIQEHDGSLLVFYIPDNNEKDLWGVVIPGMRVYQKLEKKGLVFITEEEPVVFEDGEEFEFTPSVEFTELGLTYVNYLPTKDQ